MRIGLRVFVATMLVAGGAGMSATSVRADGIAPFPKTLSVGGGSNQFGNDPDATTWPIGNPPPQMYPNFWANIAGGGTAKEQGDAYAADWCDGMTLATDGCVSVGNGENLDYTGGKGYYYTVDVTGSGSIDLQAFDPAFVDVGQLCQANTSAHLGDAAGIADVPGYPEGAANTADRLTRYAAVTNDNNLADPAFLYCTGDQAFPNSAGQIVAPATTYTVLAATLPGLPADAVPVPGCDPITYPGFEGNIATALAAGTTPDGAPAQLSTYFRQWVTLCQVMGQPGEEFFIEVSTDSGSGDNRFSLRGETPDGGAAPVTVAGDASMSISDSLPAGQQTAFRLARVPSSAAGLTLDVNLFDIGDGLSIGSLQILPPADSNVGATFGGTCEWTGSAGTGALGFAPFTPRPPWGTLSALTDCAMPDKGGSAWNGQWSTVQIPIPSDYTCNDSDPQGCWLTISYGFAGALFDTTTWNAYLVGTPSLVTTVSAAPGNASATVAWHAAANHGSAIAGYIVTPYESGIAQAPQEFDTTASSDVVTGLTNGASYTFTVTAENAAGSGPPSAESAPIVVGVPGAPTGVTAMRPSVHTLRVSFAPPASNGAPITRYTATCVSATGGATTGKAGIASPVVVTGLTPAQNYSCFVRATNRWGSGQASRRSATVRA